MSVGYNPNITTTGLTFCLDAGNKRSYPGSGATWYDASTSKPASTLFNSPTYTSTGGAYFTFDGTDDFGTMPNTQLGNGNLAWTVSAWVKSSTTVDGLGLGSVLSNASGGPVYSMMGINAGKICYWTYYSDAWRQKLGVATVNNNVWHMLTWAQYTNYTMDMYVDGVIDKNVDNSTSGNNNPIDRFGGSWAGYFSGQISQILIYQDVTLTASQILQNFNATRMRYGV